MDGMRFRSVSRDEVDWYSSRVVSPERPAERQSLGLLLQEPPRTLGRFRPENRILSPERGTPQVRRVKHPRMSSCGIIVARWWLEQRWPIRLMIL